MKLLNTHKAVVAVPSAILHFGAAMISLIRTRHSPLTYENTYGKDVSDYDVSDYFINAFRYLTISCHPLVPLLEFHYCLNLASSYSIVLKTSPRNREYLLHNANTPSK